MTTTAPGMQQAKLPAWEEYLNGVAGGLGKVITGHPFDTVKGRVQSGAFATSREAFSSTLKMEGPKAFFQGILPPCFSVGFVSGTLFFANSRIRALLQPDPNIPLTYQQMAIAGGGAGAITALFLTPLDQIKLWQQVEKRTTERAAREGAKTKKAAAAAAAAEAAAKAAGPALGTNSIGNIIRVGNLIGTPQLYRGFTATLLREIGTFGIFFPCNEFLKASLVQARSFEAFRRTKVPEHEREPPKPLPLHLRVLAAGTSGVICWLPCYPIDVIKSRQQLQGHPMLSKTGVPVWQGLTMRATAIQIFREEGPRGFTRGIGPCLLRAFPTYTAQFTLFDFLHTRALERRRAAAAAAAAEEGQALA